MIIESILVSNYRSILNETLYCDDLTVLVGANGSGKSSFLQALNLFYSTSPKVDLEDFYNKDTGKEIIVAITFKELTKEEKELFAIYIQGGKLRVERVFIWDNGKITHKYHGATLQNLVFKPIRDGLDIKDRGKTAKEAYERISSMPDYNSLPPWSNLGTVQDSLKQWEAEHPDRCIRQRDDGQFFGFTEVGHGYLGKFTRFLFIPAVRDASEDSAEGRGSVLTALMDLVVRSVVANKEAVTKLKEETQKKYIEIMDPANLEELTTLADKMTKTLSTFVPNTKVDLLWLPLSEVDIPMPQADVKLNEDGYSSAVLRTGHGLQRAFILTVLQHLALAQTLSTSTEEPKQDSKLPNLVLAIEEPELYQHPNRQRHLAKILLQLASGKTPGVADRTQIIYATHSPLFVGIDRINQIRSLRKIDNGKDVPKITKVVSTNLDEVAEEIWKVNGKIGEKYTGLTLLPRLQAIMTPWMNEGFFADIIVLVEGEEDHAVISGVAKTMGYDLEGNGFSIIPCNGKVNIDRPYMIFRKLGIPVYIIWDSDYGKGKTEGVCKDCERPLDKKANPEDNRRLLRLIGESEEDWPEYFKDTHSCFQYDLETTFKKEIGEELFEQLLNDCQTELCIRKRKHALKNPYVFIDILNKAKKQNKNSPTIMSIVEKILALKK